MKISTEKTIIHNLPYEAISSTVSKDTTGTETVEGKTILRAGSLVAGIEASIFDDRSQLVQVVDGVEGLVDGITLQDVDLTDNDAQVAVVYRGTVYANKVNGGTEVPENAKEQLNLIKFVTEG